MDTDFSDVIALIVDGIKFGKRGDGVVVLAALGVSRFGGEEASGDMVRSNGE